VLFAAEDLDAELAAAERRGELAGGLLVARRQRVRGQELGDVKPTPSSSATVRNGRSVTAAIGARITGTSMSI